VRERIGREQGSDVDVLPWKPRHPQRTELGQALRLRKDLDGVVRQLAEMDPERTEPLDALRRQKRTQILDRPAVHLELGDRHPGLDRR
jgi:hypothetical protein